MKPPDRVRIRHMKEFCAAITSIVAGRKREDLDSDLTLCLAVTRALEVIGEAASKVSPEGQAELPDVPWPQIVGMRNRLVHAYFDINRDILWTTATEVVPRLAERLKNVPTEDVT